jgi:hypothetical protein
MQLGGRPGGEYHPFPSIPARQKKAFFSQLISIFQSSSESDQSWLFDCDQLGFSFHGRKIDY